MSLRAWLSGTCAAFVLAGCTSVVGGTGRLAAPAGTPSSSATAASPSSAPSDPRLRQVDSDYTFGDPVTANFCAGAPRSSFRKWGDPQVHWWQSAGRCYYDVSIDENNWFQVETSVFRYFNRSDGTIKQASSGAKTWEFPVRTGDCERAFEPADVEWAIDVHADVADGHVPAATLCAAAKVWLDWAKTAYVRHRLPRRSLARPSITRFDLCQLVTLADIASVAGLEKLNEDVFDLGGSCYGSGQRFKFDLQAVFLDKSEKPASASVTIGRHTMGTYGDTTGCQAFSPQGTTSNRAGRENLVMQVTPHEGTETTHALCRAATAALAKVLDTAGLH